VSPTEPLARIQVGVVVERRRARSAWVDYIWRPVAVLPGAPTAAPWTVLHGEADRVNFYAGAAAIELHRSDAGGYRDNLASEAPLVWVVLRPSDGEPPYSIAAVTAEPGEGEAFAESATDIVDAVPMPEPLRAAIAEFVGQHQTERSFVKREREHVNREAGTRRALAKVRR